MANKNFRVNIQETKDSPVEQMQNSSPLINIKETKYSIDGQATFE